MDPHHRTWEGARLASELREAVVRGELRAFYQPQYDVTTLTLVALEALCRWRHPREGLLPPDRFIHIAERYGLIAAVDNVMLEVAARECAWWHRRGLTLGMSINISPTELGPGFASSLLSRVSELDLPHRVMTVEITESPAFTYTRNEIDALQALIDGGIGVSIDDFGIGNASLALVRDLPITEVKIDKSLMGDGGSIHLIHECVSIAHDRGAIVVAEGVESEEQVHWARAWGCDRVQGHYLSPALPPSDVEDVVLAASGEHGGA